VRATPGAHPLIRAAWIAAIALLSVAAALAVMGTGGRLLVVLLAAAFVAFAAGYASYVIRHLVFERVVRGAEKALDDADVERARATMSPLLARYPDLPVVQRAAGRTLYALGDPLSAASLLEKAARSFRDDAVLAATLVASYAALNRGGDARRAAALAPRHVDVRLALAWSELVALGGDRAAGRAMAAELRDRADVRGSAPREAMAAALGATAWAYAGDARAAQHALAEVARLAPSLPPFERAFIGYLEGVALRELGRAEEAVGAFERAMAASPNTIGEALARRELANLRARLAAHSSSPSSQPSSD
jgi:tetratricopeptide (TPR) repeat protein